MNVLYRKIETVIYVLCLNLIGALWLLLHADMSIRDSHNVSLDTITLRRKQLKIYVYQPISLYSLYTAVHCFPSCHWMQCCFR